MRWWTTASLLVILAPTTLLGAGCGVPDDGTVHAVPPDLLTGRNLRSPRPTHQVAPGTIPLTIYFTNRSGGLTAVVRTISSRNPPGALQAGLALLTAGPTTAELGRGLGSALPPLLALRTVGIENGQATISLHGDRLPSTEQAEAIGQVVLSATAMPGVDQVRLIYNREPLSAPLPNGVLVDRPLIEADYEELVTPLPRPTVSSPAPPQS